jgi:hypothetical protein
MEDALQAKVAQLQTELDSLHKVRLFVSRQRALTGRLANAPYFIINFEQ